MWGSRGDSRLGDWSDFVFKSKSSDVCLLKYPVETAAEFQLCWYLARLKQSNVQRDTLQEQWHTRSTPVPVDIWTVQRVAQTWPACPRHSKQNGNVWRCNSSKAIHHLVTSRGKTQKVPWNVEVHHNLFEITCLAKSAQFIGGLHGPVAYFCTTLQNGTLLKVEQTRQQCATAVNQIEGCQTNL